MLDYLLLELSVTTRHLFLLEGNDMLALNQIMMGGNANISSTYLPLHWIGIECFLLSGL